MKRNTPEDEIKRVSQLYVLKFTPIQLDRSRFSDHSVYDDIKHIRTSRGIWLQNQHDDKPVFKGNLRIVADFYFLNSVIPYENRYKINPVDYTFKIKNSLLIESVKNLCIDFDIICKNAIIVSTYSEKHFEKGIPRTEFTIIQLKS